MPLDKVLIVIKRKRLQINDDDEEGLNDIAAINNLLDNSSSIIAPTPSLPEQNQYRGNLRTKSKALQLPKQQEKVLRIKRKTRKN